MPPAPRQPPLRPRPRRDEVTRPVLSARPMSDFLVALGLVFVIEGIVFAAFPEAAKRAVTAVLETPVPVLRAAG